MAITLNKASAKELLILLAQKYNTEPDHPDFSKIDIEKIQNNTASRIQNKLWCALHPAHRVGGFKLSGWRELKESAIAVFYSQKEVDKNKDYNFGCTYDVINTLVSVSRGKYKRSSYSPSTEAIECIEQYLDAKISDLIDLADPVSNLESALNSNTKFNGTNWYGYYRTRHPLTKRICIIKCCIQIDESGLVTIDKTQETENKGNFYNYMGRAEMNQNQLLLKVKEDRGNDVVLFIFSIPTSIRIDRLQVMHGVYVQTIPHSFATRVRSIVLVKSKESWEAMSSSLLELTSKDENGSISFPFEKKYKEIEPQVKRLLFERSNNYLATISKNLSKSTDFNRKLREWDLSFFSKARPIIDIYISCPINAYTYSDTAFDRMKSEVLDLARTLKNEIIFEEYPKGNVELIIRTPFDDDRLPKRNSKPKIVNPKFVTKEIQNTNLFVLYYPDTSVTSSCIVEASWAIQAGVSCLFIVDKEDRLPRYLRRSAFIKEYPIYICEGGKFEPSEEVSNGLGSSISFKN